jgi:lipid-A-disaccharide synthase
MVNLIAGRRVVPELIQKDVTGERIAREVADILSNPQRLDRMKAEIASVREQIVAGGIEASERAARLIVATITGNGPSHD